jgi:hypothetical protein
MAEKHNRERWPMGIDQWWPRLPRSAREALIAHNGDVVDGDLVRAIERASGPISGGESWVGHWGPDGLFLSDTAVDWVEAVANGESPGPIT